MTENWPLYIKTTGGVGHLLTVVLKRGSLSDGKIPWYSEFGRFLSGEDADRAIRAMVDAESR